MAGWSRAWTVTSTGPPCKAELTRLCGTSWGYGTVFKATASGSLTAIHSFSYEDGAYPSSTLVQGGDGNFYGTAQNGGTNGGWGTIFKITPAGILTPLFSFANTNGARAICGPGAG